MAAVGRVLHTELLYQPPLLLALGIITEGKHADPARRRRRSFSAASTLHGLPGGICVVLPAEAVERSKANVVYSAAHSDQNADNNKQAAVIQGPSPGAGGGRSSVCSYRTSVMQVK